MILHSFFSFIGSFNRTMLDGFENLSQRASRASASNFQESCLKRTTYRTEKTEWEADVANHYHHCI